MTRFFLPISTVTLRKEKIPLDLKLNYLFALGYTYFCLLTLYLGLKFSAEHHLIASPSSTWRMECKRMQFFNPALCIIIQHVIRTHGERGGKD